LQFVRATLPIGDDVLTARQRMVVAAAHLPDIKRLVDVAKPFQYLGVGIVATALLVGAGAYYWQRKKQRVTNRLRIVSDVLRAHPTLLVGNVQAVFADASSRGPFFFRVARPGMPYAYVLHNSKQYCLLSIVQEPGSGSTILAPDWKDKASPEGKGFQPYIVTNDHVDHGRSHHGGGRKRRRMKHYPTHHGRRHAGVSNMMHTFYEGNYSGRDLVDVLDPDTGPWDAMTVDQAWWNMAQWYDWSGNGVFADIKLAKVDPATGRRQIIYDGKADFDENVDNADDYDTDYEDVDSDNDEYDRNRREDQRLADADPDDRRRGRRDDRQNDRDNDHRRRGESLVSAVPEANHHIIVRVSAVERAFSISTKFNIPYCSLADAASLEAGKRYFADRKSFFTDASE